MGVSTSSSASFGTMASNIKNIKGSISINATGYSVHTENGHTTSGIVSSYIVQITTFMRPELYGVSLSNTGEGIYDIDILTYVSGYIWTEPSTSATIINATDYATYNTSFIDSNDSYFRYCKLALKVTKNGSRYNVYTLGGSLLYTGNYLLLCGANKSGGTGYFSVFMTKF